MNRDNRRCPGVLHATTATLCLAVALLASPAQAEEAQSTSTGSTTGLNEIVVTARKVAENQQNVPVAVTAFSGADLNRQNAAKLSDIAAFTPGFKTIEAPSNPTGVLFSSRGQVQNDNLATLDPSVGTYIDGMYVARSYGLNSDLVDVQSVQILKGPQGTLFGRNTSAGAILIDTAKPDPTKISGKVTATYGRFNEFRGTAVLNVPLVTDQLAVRGAFQYRTRDGWMTDTKSGTKYNNIDNISGRVKALWQPTDSFSLIASGEWFRYKARGQARQLNYVAGTALIYQNLASNFFPVVAGAPTTPATVAGALAQAAWPPAAQVGAIGTDPNKVSLSDAPLTDTKTQTYSLTGTLETGVGTLKAIGGYRKITARANLDLDGSPYSILQTTGYQDLHQWSAELQLTGKTSKLDYAVGVTYFTEGGYDRSSSNNAVSFATFLAYTGQLAAAGVPAGTFLPNTTNQFRGDINNKSFGIYSQVTYHVSDRLSLTGGLRWSTDKKKLVTHNGASLFNQTALINCSLPALTTLANDNCSAGHSDRFSRLSYTAGFDYKLAEHIMFYAKAGRGYRSGGENLRAIGDARTFDPFKPEINDEQEIGFKTEFLDRRVRFNIAGYHNVISGAQRSLLLGVPGTTTLLTVLYNAEKQETFGLEAELAARITPDLTLSATGAVTDPKYKKYTQPIAFGSSVTVDHSRDAFVYIPKSSFTVAADYRHTFGFGTVSARADLSWSDKYYNAADLYTYSGTTITPNLPAAIQSFTTPAAAIVGAQLGVELNNGLSVTLWGKNLTNNRDFVQALYIGSLGLTTGNRRDPVTYGATVGFDF